MSDVKNKGRRHIRKRTLYAIILIVMLACLFMIGFLLLFQVKKIEVSGNRYLTKQEIADWMEEDELSTNSIYLMIKYHLMDYKLLPAMEEVKVSMKNPWTMRVKVTEKRVVGYIEFGDDCIYFDKDGIVLAQTTEWWDDIPCIEGLSVDKVKLYEELPVSKENKKVFENLLEMSQSLKKYELTPDRIICSDKGLYLFFGKVCVVLGDDNFGDKIAQVPPILAKLGEQGGTLYLENYSENNTTVSFDKDVLPELPAAEQQKEGEASEADGGQGDAEPAGEEDGGTEDAADEGIDAGSQEEQ